MEAARLPHNTEHDNHVRSPELVRADIGISASRNGRKSGRAKAAARRRETACRYLNMVAAVFMIVLTAPLMLVIAVAVRLTSPGPILYMQPRVGIDRRNGGRPSLECQRRFNYGGRPFRLFKFRTMYVNGPNSQEEAMWARPDDPRVTPVGRFLRKTRMDELPQLINVLRGDMNVVGPRPEQPKIFADLSSKIERYGERQQVLPGITGWAQINQHYDSTLEDVKSKLQLDLEYIEDRSVAKDLRILLETVPVVLLRRGAW